MAVSGSDEKVSKIAAGFLLPQPAVVAGHWEGPRPNGVVRDVVLVVHAVNSGDILLHRLTCLSIKSAAERLSPRRKYGMQVCMQVHVIRNYNCKIPMSRETASKSCS